MIRLLAFDLDGTTITQNRYLSPGNRQALIAAQARGVELVPATGRMRSFLPEIITELPGVRYAITSNGAAVYDLTTDTPIFERLIPNEKACKVQEILEDYDVYIEYYQNGKAITKAGNPEKAQPHYGMPEAKMHFINGKAYRFVDSYRDLLATGLCPEKINLPYLVPGLREEIWQRIDALGGLRLTSSLPDNIEINSADANKGAALRFVAELLHLEKDDLMAIGDNGNDVAMLEAAGCSVAVGDGDPLALAAAKFVTAPHDEDGLARAVERFVLLN